MWGMSDPDLCPTWRGFFCSSWSHIGKEGSDVSPKLEVQGVRERVRARRDLFLRTVLRPARGQVRPLGARCRDGETADPGRLARDLALRRLPPVLGPPERSAGARPDAAAESG